MNVNSILRRLMWHVRNVYVRWSLYTRCNELPLSRFIRCICDGELKWLRKRGVVPAKMVKDVWAGITEEYAKLSGDTGYEKSFLLSKDIARENGKLVLIKICLNVLSARYSGSCVNCLRKLGYNYEFLKDDPVSFQKDWERVRKKVRMIALELKEKRVQYEKLLASSSKRSTHETFSRSLSVLSKYMGYRIDPERVSVEEYLTIQKQYDKEIKAQALSKNSKVS